MSEHKANIKWARNGADFGYKNYSRDHIWRFDNGVEVPGSAAPAYLGNPQRVDPETAFVAALSSCHMLTFLAVASNKGFVVDSYEDNAVGRLEKNVDGKFAITRVELHPKISYSGDKQPTQTDIDWLHDKAHRECFIANSVTAEIRVMALSPFVSTTNTLLGDQGGALKAVRSLLKADACLPSTMAPRQTAPRLCLPCERP